MPNANERDGDGVYDVVALVGSLRRQSLNRNLLRAAQELKPEAMRIVEAPIRDLPLFDEDLETQGDPAPVQQFKAAILAADALLVVTPEYNQSIPGVLKNAIDWASRRYGTAPALAGKPVAMLGASSGRIGTSRAQLHLRQLFPYLDMRLLPKPEVYVPNAAGKFDPAGNLTDERTRDQVRRLLAALLDWTVLLSHAPAVRP
ncbi:MAG: NAD(P)H-dependent oxidoreductase [Chloroflexota bacterium]|nr:NAD(P)H-dependent oxidoreductase [Chloroflexota bacterium]